LRINFVCLLAIVMALLFGWGVGPVAQAEDSHVVSLQSDPVYDNLHIQLQALVNTLGFHTTNHFCVIAYGGPKKDDSITPYVYWPTQNKIIILGFGSDLILDTTFYFDLMRDILPDGEVTNSYLHRSDVNDIVQDCRAHGNAYTITKTAGGWVPIDKFSQFSSVKAQLQYLVDKKASQKTNDFCVIGQKDGTFLGAYVYWRTENRLIFWFPSPYDVDDPFAVTYAAIQIDLKHGLRDKEDAEDTRNEMQRSYANTILKACQKSGQNFVVTKSDGKELIQ
jgi:hypothetical protein